MNIIKKYKRVKLIKNKKRSNKSAPLNQINGILRAFKKSKGNIICLMDADDYFVENNTTNNIHTSNNLNTSDIYQNVQTRRRTKIRRRKNLTIQEINEKRRIINKKKKMKFQKKHRRFLKTNPWWELPI